MYLIYFAGFGSSAVVYYATYRPNGREIAIKMIDLERFERNQIDELRKEIQVMSLCRHPNLLPIYAAFVVLNKLWILTPFLKGGSCLDILKNNAPDGLEETFVASVLYQALHGLDYLHRNNLIHRDIKAGNLILDADGQVYLADFGVSASLMDDGERKGIRKTFVGTPCWMAPEVMEMNRGYDYKADIWSLGITALELANGSAPFAKFPPMKVIYLTLSSNPPTLDRTKTKHKYSKQFKELIDLCLQRDPAKRPSAEALLRHPFFKQSKKKTFVADFLEKLSPSKNGEKLQPESSEVGAQQEANKTKESGVQTTSTSWNFSDMEENPVHDEGPSDGNADENGEIEDHLTQRLHNYVQRKKSNANKEIATDDTGKHRNSRLHKPTSPRSVPDVGTASASGLRKSRFIVDDENDGKLSVAGTKSSLGISKSTSLSSPSSSSSTDSEGGVGSEVRKGRFFVSESGQTTRESAASPLMPVIDTLIQRQSSKIGRFTLNPEEDQAGTSSVGYKVQLKYLEPNELDYAVVSKKDLEALVESNNQLKFQLDELQKDSEEKTKNPLLLLKDLEESLKSCLVSSSSSSSNRDNPA